MSESLYCDSLHSHLTVYEPTGLIQLTNKNIISKVTCKNPCCWWYHDQNLLVHHLSRWNKLSSHFFPPFHYHCLPVLKAQVFYVLTWENMLLRKEGCEMKKKKDKFVLFKSELTTIYYLSSASSNYYSIIHEGSILIRSISIWNKGRKWHILLLKSVTVKPISITKYSNLYEGNDSSGKEIQHILEHLGSNFVLT